MARRRLSNHAFPGGLTVRAAEPSDALAIARVHVDAWRSTYAGLIPDAVLVGMSERNQTVQWARMLARRRPREAILVGVDGAGIGRALLSALFDALADAGMPSAIVWVLSLNPSRFFYEAMGGRRFAERDEQLWGAVLHETGYAWTRIDPPER